MFWNQLGLTPEELCSVSWGIFMRCHMHIHTSINNICIRVLCRCNWAQYGHQDFQSATGGLKCHSGCQWCIPKKHYKLLCRFFGLILKTQWDLLKNHYKHLRGFFRVSWRPLVRSFGFCSNPLSRLGLHFCSDFFFALCMENVAIGVGQSYFTATKSWPNSPPQIPTPIFMIIWVRGSNDKSW